MYGYRSMQTSKNMVKVVDSVGKGKEEYGDDSVDKGKEEYWLIDRKNIMTEGNNRTDIHLFSPIKQNLD